MYLADNQIVSNKDCHDHYSHLNLMILLHRHFPHLLTGEAADGPTNGTAGMEPLTDDVITAWFREIMERTADLMVDWMRVGFVHGVMNTDNLSILGLTIDYGPYGWLEGYDVDWTPNTTDRGQKRYRFGNQPRVALWNLMQLANAIYPLVNEAPPFQNALDNFQKEYDKKYLEMMQSKLGLEKRENIDQILMNQLQENLLLTETDMTIFFRNLASIILLQTSIFEKIRNNTKMSYIN